MSFQPDVDTRRTETFRRDADFTIWMAFGAALMAIGALAVAVPLMPIGEPNFIMQGLCWPAAALFALNSVRYIAGLSDCSSPVVTLSANGFTDTRISYDTIPWADVCRISTVGSPLSPMLFVELSSNPASQLRLTLWGSIIRYSRFFNISPGFPIATAELDVALTTLAPMLRAYHKAYS